MPLRLSMRNYFSTNFLWTALHTSRLADLEAAEGELPRFDMAHRSLAAASVIASGAFLEATPSELFQDANDGHGVRDDGYLAPLPSEAVAAMAMVWRATNSGRPWSRSKSGSGCRRAVGELGSSAARRQCRTRHS
jgi:hypothetical protein